MSLEQRFWSKVDKGKSKECWEWQAAKNHSGYGVLHHDRDWSRLASRISVRLHGRNPKNQKVLHKCDNPPCVNPNHLYLGDQQQNMEDAVERDRVNFGEDGSNAKLTNKQVREINNKLHEGLSNTEIAKDYPVDQATISDIRCGNSWTHVNVENPFYKSYEPKANKDKLSIEDVKRIKARIKKGEVYNRIAEDFQISSSVISFIANGKRYASIEPTDKMVEQAEVKGKKGGKISCKEAREIKKKLTEKKLTHKQIAKQYGVSRTMVSQINAGKRWSDVELDEG